MIKTIDGYTSDGYNLARKKVTVRVTSDKWGETLSLDDGMEFYGEWEAGHETQETDQRRT